MMTEIEFMALVGRMREAQREYFRTRDKGTLQQSKQLEREVDAVLRQQRAPDLFGGGR